MKSYRRASNTNILIFYVLGDARLLVANVDRCRFLLRPFPQYAEQRPLSSVSLEKKICSRCRLRLLHRFHPGYLSSTQRWKPLAGFYIGRRVHRRGLSELEGSMRQAESLPVDGVDGPASQGWVMSNCLFSCYKRFPNASWATNAFEGYDGKW